MNLKSKINSIEIILTTLLLGISLLLSYWLQDFISLNSGFGWDGVSYKSVAEEMIKGEIIQTRSPFAYRWGVPFLATVINKENLLLGFFYANLIAVIILPFLLLKYFKFFISDWKIRTLLMIMFLFPFKSLTRFIFSIPATTDSWALLFITVLLILMERIKRKEGCVNINYVLFFVCTGIGAMFREITLVVSSCLLLIQNPLKLKWSGKKKLPEIRIHFPKKYWYYILPMILGLIVFLSIVKSTNPVYSGYSYISHAIYFIVHKSPSHYIVSFFIAFGAIACLLLFRVKDWFIFLYQNQHLGLCFFAFLILGYIGGSATFRLLYWAAPVAFVIIGRIIEQKKEYFTMPIVIILVIGEILSQRMFPDFATFRNLIRLTPCIPCKI